MKPFKSAFALSALIVFCSSVPAYATVIAFATRPAFNAAAPGLPIETFESGQVSPGVLTTCPGPLSSAAGSTCFPVATLLPGAIYSASSSGSMIIIGGGFPPIGNTSKVLGALNFADTLDITFTGATTAVGFDAFPGLTAGTIQFSIFGPGNVSLGNFSIPGSLSPNFFGVVSTSDLISRVNIASLASSGGELIDNVAFNTNVSPVPEPSSLVLLTGGIAMLLRLRRKIT